MGKNSKVLIFFSVLFLLTVLFIVPLEEPSRIIPTQSQITPSEPVVPMLVLHDKHLLHSDTKVRSLNDKVYFLLTKKNNRLLFFTSLEQLKPLDSDTNNIISHSDKIFHELYIGIFNRRENSLIYHRLSQTAIRAIRLEKSDQKLIKGEILFADLNQSQHIESLFITPELFYQHELNKIKTKQRS